MSTLGLLKGFPDGTFQPEGNLTREQAAVLLQRVLGGYEEALLRRIKRSTFGIQVSSGNQANFGAAWCLAGSELITAKHLFRDASGALMPGRLALVTWHANPAERREALAEELVPGVDICRLRIAGPLGQWEPLAVGNEADIRPDRKVLILGALAQWHGTSQWGQLLGLGGGTVEGERQPLAYINAPTYEGQSGGPVMVFGADLLPRVVASVSGGQGLSPLTAASPVSAWPADWRQRGLILSG